MTTLLLLCSVSLAAQNTMRVHHKDGRVQDIAIEEIDSVTFVDSDDVPPYPADDATITGGGLWGSQEQGYYELRCHRNMMVFIAI